MGTHPQHPGAMAQQAQRPSWTKKNISRHRGNPFIRQPDRGLIHDHFHGLFMIQNGYLVRPAKFDGSENIDDNWGMPKTPRETSADTAAQWLSQAQVAERLSCSTRTVRLIIARGDLVGYRVGRSRTVRIRASDLDALMRPIPAIAV